MTVYLILLILVLLTRISMPVTSGGNVTVIRSNRRSARRRAA
jgi:hypothetical protein